MSVIELQTTIPGLLLRELKPSDEAQYYQLIDRNRSHLTRNGDYAELKDATLKSVHEDLAQTPENHARFGGWFNDQLAGRFDLVPREEGNFVLGYWLGEEFTGKGLATAACHALIGYGQEQLGATDIWAGVTKGNVASVAVLNRLGLKYVKDMGSYDRFHMSLSQ